MGTRTASRRAHEATTSVDHASRTSGRPAASLRPPVSGVGLLDHAEAATGPIRLERAGAGSAGIVQAKSASSMRLTAGGHASEREADRVAERVVRGGDGGAPLAITRRPSAGDGVAIAPRVERGIVQARGDGVPLSPHHRRGVEETLDADLGQVRVHADARADRLSRSLGARAFTTGHDIFFRRGAFDPGSAAGARLLAHELTHVVQQDGAAGQVQRVGDGQGPAATEEQVAEQAEVAHAPQAHAEPQESGAGVGAAEPAVPEQAPPEQAPPELEVPELEVPEQAPPELAASEYRLESDPTIADLAPKAQEKVAAQNSAAAKPAPDLLGCTLKESLDHAGKAVVATQLDALYLEKTESAIVEDNHIVHAVRATLGVAPWDTLKPALDAKIQALQDKGDATTAEKEQLFELEQGRELLLSFGTPEKLQTAEAASDWRVEALKLWTTGVRMNQFVVERLYRHIERLHERMHLGAVHLPLPAEARARKTDAREEAADLATEAVLRKRHSRRYRDRAKIWKVDLIHKNRIAPTYSEAFGKALKFNAVRSALSTLGDFLTGVLSGGLVGRKVEKDARGFALGHVNGLFGAVVEARHAKWVGIGDVAGKLQRISTEIALVRALRAGDPTATDKFVQILQYIDLALSQVKRLLRYTSIDLAIVAAAAPPTAPVLLPVSVGLSMASTAISGARVAINALITGIRAVQMLTNSAVMTNLMKGSAIEGAVNMTSAGVSFGLNFAEAEMRTAITHTPSASPLDPVAYYEQNTSSDSSQQTEAWLASKSLSLGGKLARSLVVKETPKNKSKAYKLYRDLRKGKIEGPLMTRIGETDEAHRVFEEILASKRYDVGAAADAASVELGSLGSQVETVDAQSDAVIHSLDANREDPSVVERHGRTQSMFEGFRTIRGSLSDIGGLPALIREHIR